MALVLNGVKYLVLHQAEEGIFITGCCNKSRTETGTQLEGGGHRSVGILLPMPRAARKAPGGQVYHVLNRSVGKMHCFGKDADFEAFQRVMIEAHQRHPIRSCPIASCPTTGTSPSGRTQTAR